MKKFIAGAIFGAALMFTTSVFADGALKQITAYLTPDVSVEVNGKKVALENVPVNYDGSTYLPVRELASAVGLAVDWDDASRTAKLSSGAAEMEPSKEVHGSASGSTSTDGGVSSVVKPSPAGTFIPIAYDDFGNVIGDGMNRQTIMDDGKEYIAMRSIMAAYPNLFFDPISEKGRLVKISLLKSTKDKDGAKKESTIVIEEIPYHIYEGSGTYVEVTYFLEHIKPLIGN